MGFLAKVFGGPSGIRESMQDSYWSHRRAYESGRLPVSDFGSPHVLGLYGALSARYWARGQRRSEPELMMELAPFCAMKDVRTAIAALAEYAVYQERPADARTGELKVLLNDALATCEEDELLHRAVTAIARNVDWADLMEPSTVSRVLEAAVESVGAHAISARSPGPP